MGHAMRQLKMRLERLVVLDSPFPAGAQGRGCGQHSERTRV